MKIISKYKDYYDYYQGIYGIDNTRVYNRNITKIEPLSPHSIFYKEYRLTVMLICGEMYFIHEYKGKSYYTIDEIEELYNILVNDQYRYQTELFSLAHNFAEKSGWSYKYYQNKDFNYLFSLNGTKTNFNMKEREPVLCLNKNKYKDSKDYITPLLSDFNFHRILQPNEIYIKIETFLGWLHDNPEIPNNQTNDGKIISHGFDTKTSFRPKMKK